MSKNCVLPYLFESLFAQAEQIVFPFTNFTSMLEVRHISQRPFMNRNYS
jgi:hypothetical protein